MARPAVSCNLLPKSPKLLPPPRSYGAEIVEISRLQGGFVGSIRKAEEAKLDQVPSTQETLKRKPDLFPPKNRNRAGTASSSRGSSETT